MNSFFTPSYPERELFRTGLKRNAALKALRLQAYNDFLYEVVSQNILDRRDELYTALTDAIRTASTPRGYSTPLWTYHAAHYKESPHRNAGLVPSTSYEIMEERFREHGYDWLIGVASKTFFHETIPCWNDCDEDGEVTAGWETYWSWTHFPHRVDDIVRSTDFRHRIALLFGDDRFRVSYSTIAHMPIEGCLEVLIHKVELRLHYYPNGLDDPSRKAILDAKLKYTDYTPQYARETWLSPQIWSGRPSLRKPVETPRTPAPAPRLARPPPLARRTNGGGIHSPHFSGESTPILANRTNGGPLNPEDFDEVAQRLSFEEAPSSIHEYTGANAIELAARDAVAEWMAESMEQPKPPCYCDYHRVDPPCSRCGLPHPEQMYLYRSEGDGTVSANPLPKGYCPPTAE